MIVNEWKDITKNIKADILVLDMPILDTRQKKDLLGTFINDLILQLLSYVAQIEREKINTRQREGIDIALKNGTKTSKPFGRPKITKPPHFLQISLFSYSIIKPPLLEDILTYNCFLDKKQINIVS